MELKGKQLSLGAKLAAVFFVLLCFAVMLVTKTPIPMNDVIKVGIFIALVFSPVDISLWLEKLPPSSRTYRAPPAEPYGTEEDTPQTQESDR